MIVEPYKDRFHGIGLVPGEQGFPVNRPNIRIVTKVQAERMLDRIVDAIVTPLGELAPLV